jgi:hypothetical protein
MRFRAAGEEISEFLDKISQNPVMLANAINLFDFFRFLSSSATKSIYDSML